MPAKRKTAPRASKPAVQAGKKVTTISPREEAAVEVFALGFALLAVVFFVVSLFVFR